VGDRELGDEVFGMCETGRGVGWREMEGWKRCGIKRDGGLEEVWDEERWRDGGDVG
jgi:hypothetical protein